MCVSGGPGRGSENRADRVEVVPAAGFADEPGPLVQDLQLPLVDIGGPELDTGDRYVSSALMTGSPG